MSNSLQDKCSPSLAAERTRVLLGCYRKGDASDPEVYVTAVATVFASYPEDVVRYVTHPAHGLPSRVHWLPTVAEVVEACEEQMRPRREQIARLRREEESRYLLAAPESPDAEARARAVAHWEEIRPAFADEPTKPAETQAQLEARLDEWAANPQRVVIGEELTKKLEQYRAGQA